MATTAREETASETDYTTTYGAESSENQEGSDYSSPPSTLSSL